MDPYRTPGTPEIEGLIAELSILRQANGALAIQVHELKRALEDEQRARRNETYRANSKPEYGTLQETKDLLRAALVFLKQAEKKGAFNRSQGVGEIIGKIEGVPGVKV